LKNKDLIGIPWMVAFAIRSAGWYLRQDIIWHKPNPMPESVTDRCTKAHEYIFLLSKSNRYYYDYEAVSEPATYVGIVGMGAGGFKDPKNYNGKHKNLEITGRKNHTVHEKRANGETFFSETRNKRSVWTITTKPYSEAHFATFPEDLIVDCIKAGCPEGGIVLDPFMGAGTTALVARKLNRNFVGFELNEEYIKIAEKRLRNELGLFE
jgi:DNA modification methylase